MTLVANSGTLCATAKRLCEAACATLKDVLVDVLSACPGEATGVIAADHMKGTGVGSSTGWEDHGH